MSAHGTLHRRRPTCHRRKSICSTFRHVGVVRLSRIITGMRIQLQRLPQPKSFRFNNRKEILIFLHVGLCIYSLIVRQSERRRATCCQSCALVSARSVSSTTRRKSRISATDTRCWSTAIGCIAGPTARTCKRRNHPRMSSTAAPTHCGRIISRRSDSTLKTIRMPPACVTCV